MNAQFKPDSFKSPDRKLWKFHGGVHPPFHKEDSNKRAIAEAGIPRILVLPLKQHIGEAAELLVNEGDYVFKGQLIAEHQEFVSANIHAPSSGTVSKIDKHAVPHPSGLNDTCIHIKTDGKDDWGDYKLKPFEDFKSASPQQLLERIEQAGIVGLGGAVFPTAVKLAGLNRKPIKTLIINGAECEPYISCDDRLMREKSDEIVTGIKAVIHMIKPETCLIGIEDNKPEAIQAMRVAAANEDAIEVVVIPTIYPSGGEKQLIEILTGEEIPAGKIPLDRGLLSLNTGTVYSIYKAIVKGEPLLSRIVTVTGNGINTPQNYQVLLGTSFKYLAQQAGGYTDKAEHLIMGGPMMGFALPSDEIPVVKATNCALFISSKNLNESNSVHSNQPTMPCIRCGKCMEVCPVNLLPQQMYWHIRAKDFEKTLEHNIRDCIDCGCCSYVCPSHIPLVDYFRFAKTEIRNQEMALQKSNLSRERHEFLLYRKEREKREREEKRAAHKAALQKKKSDEKAKKGETATDSKADAIKAAMERAKARKQALKEQPGDANKKEVSKSES